MKAIAAFQRDRMTVHAAALAFRILLSMFPFFIFLLALLASLQLPVFFHWLASNARLVLPTTAMELVEQAAAELRTPNAGLLSTGAAVSLWIASSAMRALMDTLNLVFGAEESRTAWKRYTLSVLFTIGLAIMLVASAILMWVGPQAMQFLSSELGVESMFVALWGWLRIPAALLLLTLAVATTYHVLPNVQLPFRLISAGAAMAVLTWVGASAAFGFYVQNFARYNVMYGSIGTMIVLLLYLNLSTVVLLFGAEMNAVAEQQG